MNKMIISGVACFVGGILSATKGVELIKHEKTKEAVVEATAAVLRAKDCVMDTVTMVQEGAEDILAEAVLLNAEKAAEAAVDCGDCESCTGCEA